MASLALGVLGAGIGSFFSNPMLGFSLGMTLGGVLFPQNQGGRGKLDDLRITGSGWGIEIPRIWGRVRIGGNVIWSTDLVEHASSGGKGGAPESFSYSLSCAVLLAHNPLTTIQKIWADDLVIYDASASPPTQYTIRIYDGTQTTPDSFMEAQLGVGNTPSYKERSYVFFENFPTEKFGNRLPNFNFEPDCGSATVGTILEDLAQESGLTSSDYDFSAAETIPVFGFLRAQREAGKTVSESLLDVYATDLSEFDGKLWALPRGGDPALTVAASDLGAQDWPVGDTPATRVESVIAQDLELPRSVDLTYFSVTGNYLQSTQTAIRTTKGDIQQSETLNTAIVMLDNEARQAAERRLYARWRERVNQKFALPFSYIGLVPGTVVLLPVGALLKRVRITQVDVGLIGLLQLESVEDDDEGGLYCQIASGGITAHSAPTVQQIVPVTFTAWSGTELRDEDTFSPGFYTVANWPAGGAGGTVYYSPDGGTTYIESERIDTRSEFGTTTGILASGGVANAWDTDSVGVALEVSGLLTSASQPEVVAGSVNAALVGVEVTGYQNATQTGVLAFTLANFYRGRRGSVMSGHASGERFVHLTSAGVVRTSVDPSLIGTTVLVKVLAPGQVLSDVTSVSVLIVANTSAFASPADVSTAIAGDIDFIPLSNGDPDTPGLLFDDGRVLLLEI